MQYFVESALHYNYFRTYDPSTGRYLESDPIGLNGGLNTYNYGLANPLLYDDRFGLSPGEDDFVRCLTRMGNGHPENCFAKLLYDIGDAAATALKDSVSDISCDDGCDDPFVVTYHYGLSHARIKPSETIQYSKSCLLTLGLLEVGETALTNTAIDLVGQAAEKAGKKGIAQAAGIATGPVGTAITGSLSVRSVFRDCECKN